MRLKNDSLDRIDENDHPNNNFSGWLTMPGNLYPLILQFVMSGKLGHKDAVALAQTCRLFWKTYIPFSPVIHMHSVKTKLGRFGIQNHLDRLIHMGFFISFSPSDTLNSKTRLKIMQEVQKALQGKTLLDAQVNSVSDLIRQSLNWPKAETNLTMEEQGPFLALYQQFHSSVSTYTRLGNHEVLVASTRMDSAISKSIAQGLDNNLKEFINAINEIISSEALQNGKALFFETDLNRALYLHAMSVINFFLLEIERMNPKNLTINLGNADRTIELIGEVESLSNEPDYSNSGRRDADNTRICATFALPTLLVVGGMFMGGSFITGDGQSQGPMFQISAAMLAIATLGILFLFVIRPLVRNCSMQRISNNIHRFCPRTRENAVEILDENAPLLINEGAHQVQLKDPEQEGSDIEQVIINK